MFEKYKKEIVFGAIIFVVASLSFGLGSIADRAFANHAPIIIEKCASSTAE